MSFATQTGNVMIELKYEFKDKAICWDRNEPFMSLTICSCDSGEALALIFMFEGTVLLEAGRT